MVDTHDPAPQDAGPDLRSGTAQRPDLGSAMSQLARVLQDRHGSVEDTLQAISAAALVNVPGAISAGISLLTARGRVEGRAATDALPGRVSDLQTAAGEGPCLQSLHERRTVRVRAMAADTRWPRFTARMAAEPVGSMLSIPLFIGTTGLGSLSLYATDPDTFGDPAEEIGLILASHAAVALAGAQNEEGLRQALDHRDLIGQAKGILMERHKITGQQAFLALVRVSQARNVKLRDIAGRLAATGSLE